MKNIATLKKEAEIIKKDEEFYFKNKLIPIANKIFNDNKYIFLESIEKKIKQEMVKGYERMFFEMYEQVKKLCEGFNINKYDEVRFINDFIEDKLISILKEQGYLYSYVYSYTDLADTNYYIFWSKFEFLKCKIKNTLKISD
ncbi:porphobilinogen synthase [Clostridium sporogenes]|uniref:Porphobilinogen synthase n=1 Tax=Clostridium sporogenes TaxID=1509 RepID=A0A7X5SYE4_CLOSG|nr:MULTISPECIES: hypothetical protein [Clostridium]AJD29076.1 putative porphobilinogen synthase [Clostridium botulinum Prevot_594]NFL98048.1 porphobilinogen synthase [Clostridium botulinum]NFP55279.1 porphobilinogen synthase [Clostridium botulinum]NFQ17313.1 porphobilinogen synthase [Clostridium sporogenes]NFQ20878.1 porphobilinogen synthase [Clostridium sporogenes]